MGLGERLKKLRVIKKLNQSDLAKVLKVDRSTYGKYETGDSSPDYEKLIVLANYFKVSLDYLLLGDEINDMGSLIKKEREEQGHTIKELADAVGINGQELEKYEADEIPIREAVVDRIINYFGISWVALLHKYDLYDEYIPEHFNNDVDAWEAFKKARDKDAMSEVRTDTKNFKPETIAANHEREDWTEEELKDIEKFKEFIKMRREDKKE
jgi:transcriptional regulator with XRE-family HTH domain